MKVVSCSVAKDAAGYMEAAGKGGCYNGWEIGYTEQINMLRKMRVTSHTVKQPEPDQELLAEPLHFHHYEKAVTTKMGEASNM